MFPLYNFATWHLRVTNVKFCNNSPHRLYTTNVTAFCAVHGGRTQILPRACFRQRFGKVHPICLQIRIEIRVGWFRVV